MPRSRKDWRHSRRNKQFGIFPDDYGATFVKRFDIDQASLNASEAVGSPVATFTAARSASAPATTIETQQGNALLFDGVDDEVDVSSNLGIVAYPFSLEAKVRINAGSTIRTIVSLNDASASNVFYTIDVESTNFARISARNTSTVNADGSVSLDDGEFHTLLGVFRSATDREIYVDGVSANTSSTSVAFNTNTDHVTIGQLRETSPSQYFDGQIQFVKIYNTDASTDTSGLVAHYDFSDGSGSTLTDIVGGNNGTITGAKWLTNGSQYITKVTSSNTPRFTQGYYDATGYHAQPGLLIEGAGTNLFLSSTDLADAAWGGTSVVDTAGAGIAPDGSLTAARIVGTGGNWVWRETPAHTAAPNTISMWVKSNTGSNQTFRLFIKATEASSDLTATTEWRRFSFTTVGAASNEAAGIARDSSNNDADILVWGAQFEQAPYATSFIPTTTAALTRGAEVLKYAIAGNRTAATESIFVKFYPEGDFANDGIARYVLANDVANEERRFLKNTTSTKLAFYPRNADSSSVVASSGVPAANTMYVSAGIAYGTSAATNVELYINSVSNGTNATDYSANEWGTNFYIASAKDGTTQLNGTIQSVAFFSTALDATQVGNVTTILEGN